MNRKVNKRRGISLITLVITIIVMGILATAVILSLNSSGIIDGSHKAKKDTNYSRAKEVVTFARAEWDLMTDSEKEANGGKFSEYAENKLVTSGYPTTGTGSYEVTNLGKLYSYPVIPAGFVASKATGETKVSEGLVIYEGTVEVNDTNVSTAQTTRNQYVWIPVEDISEFVRRDGYGLNAVQQDYVTRGKIVEPYDKKAVYDEVLLSKENDLTGEFAEYEKMYNSVKKYGGFYIARYEAGSSTQRVITVSNGTTVLLASQKNKYPYNVVVWGLSNTCVEGEAVFNNGKNHGIGAVELSRSVYEEDNNNYGVVSTLCYGIEWDAAISFLSDIQNTTISPYKPYIQDGSNMSWNGNNKSGNSNYKTGIDLNIEDKLALNKVKNIYDMAGNMEEWTMEVEYTGYFSYRTPRGGAYNMASGLPASYRSSMSGGAKSIPDNRGFRIALYIK